MVVVCVSCCVACALVLIWFIFLIVCPWDVHFVCWMFVWYLPSGLVIPCCSGFVSSFLNSVICAPSMVFPRVLLSRSVYGVCICCGVTCSVMFRLLWFLQVSVVSFGSCSGLMYLSSMLLVFGCVSVSVYCPWAFVVVVAMVRVLMFFLCLLGWRRVWLLFVFRVVLLVLWFLFGLFF